MSVMLLLGAGLGLGLVAIVRGLRPRPPALARALDALEWPRPGGPTPYGRKAVGAAALRWSSLDHVRRSDLELADRTLEQHAVRKIAAATGLAAVPVLAVLLATTAGLAVGIGVVLLPAVGLGVLGYVLPDIELRSVARERRATFVHCLSSYLDVTAVLLAGGAGTETALHAAADLGSSWPQRRLRAALDRCRLTGQTPWQALAELGDRLEIDELSQLATSLQLAGEQGARVRLTLTERARALRATQLAAVESRARAVTEQMSVPVALLAVAFMLFVGYPAVWVVLGEL